MGYFIVFWKQKRQKTKTAALRGQIVNSVHCKWIPQQAKLRFVAEFASLLLFFDLHCCFGFQKQKLRKINLLKIDPKLGAIAESATVFAESRIVCGIHNQAQRHM